MPKQIERGTQHPMYQATLSVATAADETPILDTTPDWTDSNEITPVVGHSHNNSQYTNGSKRLAVSGDAIQVREGIYKVTPAFWVQNVSAAAEDFQFAFTNLDGSAVYFESDTYSIPANDAWTHVRASFFVHFGTMGYHDLVLRAVQSSDNAGGGTDLRIKTIEAGSPNVRGTLVMVEKIGNANET